MTSYCDCSSASHVYIIKWCFVMTFGWHRNDILNSQYWLHVTIKYTYISRFNSLLVHQYFFPKFLGFVIVWFVDSLFGKTGLLRLLLMLLNWLFIKIYLPISLSIFYMYQSSMFCPAPGASDTRLQKALLTICATIRPLE